MSKIEQIGLKVKNPRNIDVGRMVDSSQADDRKMIRLVKKRRLLYARNNLPVASQISQVKSLWQEVAFEMGWSVADVRRKWSHIRNSYSRHLRNEMHGARTGKGRIVSKWYLADELEFLREHMATDTRTSPYSAYAPQYLEMDMSESSSNPENVDVKPFLHNSWFALPTPQTALNGFSVKQEINIQSDDSCSSQAFGPDENCSFFQFFRGIYNDYQELSNKKKRLFKRQCLSFLHDLLDEDEKQEIEINFRDQRDAINLSNSGHNATNEESETKVFKNIEATSMPTEEIIDE